MNKKMLNTTYDFELADGSIVKLTLAFYALYQLKAKNKSLYERYNKIMANNAKGGFEELDSIAVLYTAYVCANMSSEDLMSEEDFMMLCGTDRMAVNKAMEHLTNPKKAQASGNRSK